MNQTVFKDVRQKAKVVYRVKTRSSEYLIGIHESDGRRFAIVRGMLGTDRENAISRDSDPRVGGHSMFELPLAEWPGKMLEVATMTTSPIVTAVVEVDPRYVAAVAIDTIGGRNEPAASPQHAGSQRSPWARPDPNAPPPPSADRAAAHAPPPAQPQMPAQSVPPTGPPQANGRWAPVPGSLPENPRIVPQPSKGTHPAIVAAEIAKHWQAQGGATGAPTVVDLPAQVQGGPNSYAPVVVQASPIVQQVVLGQQAGGQSGEAQLPYPQRHVGYAESCAALLRSIAKRDRLFEDLARDKELKERLRRALDDCATLLEQIRRRDRA